MARTLPLLATWLTLACVGYAQTLDAYRQPLPKGAIARLGHRVDTANPITPCASASSPDGKRLAMACGTRVILWDLPSGNVILNLVAHEYPLRGLAFLDDDTLLTQGHDGQRDALKTWSLPSGKLVRSVVIPVNWAGTAFSHDGKLLALTTPGDPNTLHVWDTQTGKELFADKEHYPHVFFSPDNRLVIASRRQLIEKQRYNTHVTMRDARTGEIVRKLELKETMATITDISADGKHLIGHTFIHHDMQDKWRSRLQLFDAETGVVLKTIHEQRSGDMKGAHFSPDGQLVVAVNHEEHGISVWEVASGQKRWTFADGQEFFNYPKFARDGKMLVNTTYHGRVFIHDLATDRTRDLNPTHSGYICSLAFSPDGKHLASSSRLSEFYLWDTQTNNAIRRFVGNRKTDQDIHEQAVQLAFAPDGKHLLAKQTDQRVRLYHAFRGKEVVAFRDAGHVWDFSEDGQHLLWTAISLQPPRAAPYRDPPVVADDYTYWLGSARWVAYNALHPVLQQFRARAYFTPRLKTDAPMAPIPFGMMGQAGELVASPHGISPDGSVLVTMTSRRTGNPFSGMGMYWVGDGVILWDTTTMQQITRIPRRDGHDPTFLRMTHDSRGYLVNFHGRQEATVALKLFETRTGRERLHIAAERAQYSGFDLSRDGRWLAYVDANNAIVVFDLTLGETAATFPQHDASVRLAFSPDASRLASGGHTGTILLWDLEAIRKRDRKEPAWNADDKSRLWTDLASSDAGKAYAAIMKLKRSPDQAVPLLRSKLDWKQSGHGIGKLIQNLGHADFATRQKANDALEQQGERARPHLLRALPNVASLEHKRRVEAILDKLTRPFTSPFGLRMLRSVEVLDALATADAVAQLREIAADVPANDPIGREVARALRRSERR
jgi:WD40 repeat protein